MSEHSTIEWTEATWNPVRGCQKISPGCKHCYAETFAERFRGVPGHPYEHGFDPRLVPEKLLEPLSWTSPKTVFVNSMSDLFQDVVPDGYILAVAEVMLRTPWHTYQVLTKRSTRMKAMLRSQLRFAAAPDHVDVEREIAGAERDAPDPRAGSKDRAEPIKPLCGFDNRDQVYAAHGQAALAFELRQQPVDRGEPGGGFDLWQDDPVNTGKRDREQVAVAELGIDGVDPDIQETAPRTRERSRHRLAGGRFLDDCDRVLQIEDDRVGVERQRLLDPPRVVAGSEQKTA